MKKFSLLLMGILFAGAIMAQAPVITFDKTTHDFKKIREQDSIATTIFTFKNTGDAPLVINRVHASCGCTTPVWTKEPVMPGKTGTVKVAYNTVNRPGPFIKTISVFSNADTKATVLNIKGEVTPKPAVSL